MRNNSIKTLTRCAMFAALIALCAWLAIPGPGGISFTLQSFGVTLTLLLLGGKKGTLTIGTYLLLGVAGAPVFSGFRGGIGVLLDASGGYLLGFLVFGLIYWLMTARNLPPVLAITTGAIGCYLFGAAWYLWVYLPSGSSFFAACSVYVLPYLLPDGLKIALAFYLRHRLSKFV